MRFLIVFGLVPSESRDADGGRVQGWDFLLQGVVELRVHARPPAHAAGFVEGDVFELDESRGDRPWV